MEAVRKDEPGGTGGGDAALRHRHVRPLTIPEQIADRTGIAILRDEYAAGERLRESDLAEQFGVSRAPVREAIRLLEQRGLVVFTPRKGAFAVAISLDVVADLFNIRATLIGLAARSFARSAGPEAHAELDLRLRELAAVAQRPDCDPITFAAAVGRSAGAIYQHCGNEPLHHMLSAQVSGSVWGLVWRDRPIDFLTLRRRAEALVQWRAVRAAIRAGDDALAERLARRNMFISRDIALATLASLRDGTVQPAKMLHDDDGSAAARPARAR